MNSIATARGPPEYAGISQRLRFNARQSCPWVRWETNWTADFRSVGASLVVCRRMVWLESNSPGQ
jgi:hypothetical protein